MKHDNLYTSTVAREKLMAGVTKAVEAVAVTMGTSGSNSLIECLERPHHYTTNDGATILGSIKFADELEEMGRLVLHEAVSRANKRSGDGSSTTAVLTAAILEEGMKHIGDSSPMEIKRSLEKCIPFVEKFITDKKVNVIVDGEMNLELLEQVATVSAEDEEIGKRVAEIYSKIGKDGIISWDVSKTTDDSYTLGTGIMVPGATYIAPYMCDEGSTEVRMKEPYVLLAKKKITSALDFETLFPALFNRDVKEILIFCDDIDVQVISDLFKTQRIRGFKAVVVKMPVLWADEWWEDLAVASGATLIDVTSGIKLSDATIDHLGRFGNVRITKDETYIDGINDMSKHILALQVGGSDKELLRASRLNTRTARYFVGAHSDSALAYRRLKVEDAINAASCALNNGIVTGGGVALFEVARNIGTDAVGEMILEKALRKPAEQIMENAGISADIPNDFKGFNTKTGKAEDLFKSGIVDPTDVVLNAVKSAIGVAASILTVGSVITLPREEEKPEQPSLIRR